MDFDWNWRKWSTYFDRAYHAVNFEFHDGHNQMDVRKVMKDLCIYVSDGVHGWIWTICRFPQCLGEVWAIFGSSKRLQFGRCCS